MTSATAISNTGKNNAVGNMGGMTRINTGKATSKVNVKVTGGKNKADLPDECLCSTDGGTVKIKKNGPRSRNRIRKRNLNVVAVGQNNQTSAMTFAGVKSNTGKNNALFNMGRVAVQPQPTMHHQQLMSLFLVDQTY